MEWFKVLHRESRDRQAVVLVLQDPWANAFLRRSGPHGE